MWVVALQQNTCLARGGLAIICSAEKKKGQGGRCVSRGLVQQARSLFQNPITVQTSMAPYTPSPSLGRGKQEEQAFKVIGHPLLHFEASLGDIRLSLTKNKNTRKEEKE